VAKRVPSTVIYLISALEFHNLTTQITHSVWIAIENKRCERNIGRREAEQKMREALGRSLGASCNEKSRDDPICNSFSSAVTVFLVEARRLGLQICNYFS